jgi:hypothetical protein
LPYKTKGNGNRGKEKLNSTPTPLGLSAEIGVRGYFFYFFLEKIRVPQRRQGCEVVPIFFWFHGSRVAWRRDLLIRWMWKGDLLF